MKRNRKSRRNAFTLLEVLLVVGIIALLAAAVVPRFMNTQAKTEIKLAQTAVSDNGPIASQIELFHQSMQRYPKELSELTTAPEDEDEKAKWAGPYIADPAALKDPWGHEIKYKQPGEVRTDGYDLWSDGPDGQEGTDDDITNYKKEK